MLEPPDDEGKAALIRTLQQATTNRLETNEKIGNPIKWKLQ